MKKSDLTARARRLGIVPRYRTETGETVALSAESLSALVDLLEPMGAAEDERAHAADPDIRCPRLAPGTRLWGVTCQLYGLHSQRTLDLGDFADLARFGQDMAALGAQFVGLNPLHALFRADPGRISPYSPSTRRYINPLYIAIDWIVGGEAVIEKAARDNPGLMGDPEVALVDHERVAAFKLPLLRTLFESGAEIGPAFDAYCRREGRDLDAYAAFEILSARHQAAGRGAGWHTWPSAEQQASDALIEKTAHAHPQDALFSKWLQFVADSQLARVQKALQGAGMRVGLYLDLAIGVAPDGFDTWADPELTTPGARIGAPPDAFNAEGQDWGLAPIVPSKMAQRDFAPYRDTMAAITRHAGAIRIDHAMALERLWWIPQERTSPGGGYVRYPFDRMVGALASAANAGGTLVVGEDLGTVPRGFRGRIARANIHSYRVLYFERDEAGTFHPPGAYPVKSMASVSTHDLPTLTGWWKGYDIDLRLDLGLIDAKAAKKARKDRIAEKRALLRALAAEGLEGDAAGPDSLMTPELLAAIHALLARARSALMAVQLEDLLGLELQANMPGTVSQHPNWQRRYPVSVEAMAGHETLRTVATALAQERPAAGKGRP